MVRRTRAGAVDLLVLLAILAVAALFRFNGLDWDRGTHQHPDERFLTQVASTVGLPKTFEDYFATARAPLNPYIHGFQQYAYGQLPLTMTRVAAEITGMTGYDKVNIAGRVLSMLMDLITIVFAWLLARRVLGVRHAHLTAALLAVTVLHIQLAHYFAVDTFVATFAAGALFFGQRAWQRGSLVDAVWAGLFVGFATASKISAAALLPVLLVGLAWPRTAGPKRDQIMDGLTAFAVVLLAFLVSFRITEPYAFLGPGVFNLRINEGWVQDKVFWAEVSAGAVDVPYMIQWAGTSAYSFVLQAIVQWGTGPLMGMAALLGLVWSGWSFVRGKPGAREMLLVLLWAALNLAYFGGQFAKFMRYMLPTYFALAILASYFVLRIAALAPRGRLAYVGRGFVALVVLATAGWAVAFSNVYAQDHSRIQASEWIFANIPAGQTLATEHWDDRIPIAVAGREGNEYRYLELPLYDGENAAKRDKIIASLDGADYVILASRRLADSVPRLPERYPLGTEYYKLLFAGRLGFERFQVFQVTPALGPLKIDDSRAQEDFTVYDHPTVEIWKKRADYSTAEVRSLLGAVPLETAVNVKPSASGKGVLLLSPTEEASAVAGGTWSDLFHRGDFANTAPVLVWLLASELMALLAFPMLWAALGRLPDRGFGAAKTIGAVAVAYLVWLAASVRAIPFSRGSIVLAMLLIAWGSALVVWRRKAELTAWIRKESRLLITVEAVFLVGFALFLAIRMINPDLWHPQYGGEKPMNFAYLNAVIKSEYFPPYDPWFAGGYINYYYWGFVLVGSLVKLTGIVPEVAFNIAQPWLYGALCAGTFSTAFALVGATRGKAVRLSYLAGGVAVLLMAVLGNLDAGVQLLDQLTRQGKLSSPESGGLLSVMLGAWAVIQGQRFAPLDFWRSTRFIGPEDPGPIHEFPYFTWLYGDLHAHQIALPMTIAMLAVLVALVRSARRDPGKTQWSLAVIGGLLLGALRPTNTWDFPTYAAVSVAAIGFGYLPALLKASRPAMWSAGITAGVLLGLSQVLFLPYLQRYQLFYGWFDPVKAKTAPEQYLLIWGLFFFLVSSLLLWYGVRALGGYGFGRRGQPQLVAESGFNAYVAPVPLPRSSLSSPATVTVVCGVLMGLGFATTGFATRGIIVFLLAGALAVLLSQWRHSNRGLQAALVAVALFATFIPEVITLQGDIGRMNTVFKFYLQTWAMLSIAAAVALAWLMRRKVIRRVPLEWRIVWSVFLALLTFAGLSYPLLASQGKVGLRFAQIGPGLDGMAYMTRAQFSDRDRDLNLRADSAAIKWLQDNVKGSPVVLEGRAPVYRWGSRISVYTGLPTLLGWDVHQSQQRSGYSNMIQGRSLDVERAYGSNNPADALAILKKYDVRYVYVGGLERAYYPAPGLEKLKNMSQLRIVYDADGVQIYEVTS